MKTETETGLRLPQARGDLEGQKLEGAGKLPEAHDPAHSLVWDFWPPEQ